MQIRITIVDEVETISFSAPTYLLKMVIASCSKGVGAVRELVVGLGAYDPEFSARLRAALGRDSDDTSETNFDGALSFLRVLDSETRQESLTAIDGGLVIFNLVAKRIVLVAMPTGSLTREGRGRMRRNGRSIAVYYSYRLPADWTIVP